MASKYKAGDDFEADKSGEIWDRMTGEHNDAWAGFQAYRNMGLERSLPKAAAELGKPRTTLATWSSRFSWLMRAAAWDAEMDRRDQLWLAEQRRHALTRHVRQAQMLQSKWLSAMATLQPDKLAPADVIRWAEVATRMEREALELADAAANVTVNITALSPEDTLVRLADLQREINERLVEVSEAGHKTNTRK